MRASVRFLLGAFVAGIFLFGSVIGLFAKERPALCIQGTMAAEKKPIAIINDQIVAVGDDVAGARVVSIADSSVDFEYDGEVFSVWVDDECEGGARTRTSASGGGYRSGTKRTTPSKFSKIPKSMRIFEEGSSLVVLYGILVFITVLYVYCAICLQKIAQKAECGETAWQAWVPILNLFLIADIGQKPWWWILVLLVPYVNLIALAVLWMGVAEAREKPAWFGIFMAFPVLNLFMLGYLAFSK